MKKAAGVLFIVFGLAGRLGAQSPQVQPLQFYCAIARPTVFRSWEPVKITYCLKYLTRARDGRTLKIITDFKEVNFNRYEADGAPQIESYKKGDEVHLRITYVLRRADHAKGQDNIPPFIVQYAIERPGESSADQYTAKSRPLFLEYVSTITENSPDIRDGVDFGSFRQRVYVFSALAILIFALPLLLLVRELFFGRIPVKTVDENDEEVKTPIKVEVRRRLRPRVARRILEEKIDDWLKKVKARAPNIDEALAIEAGLHEHIRNLILAELPNLKWGKTPAYILSVVSAISDGKRKEILLSFALLLKTLQDDLDRRYPRLVLDKAPVVLKRIKDWCFALRWAGVIDLKAKFNLAFLKVRKLLKEIFGWIIKRGK